MATQLHHGDEKVEGKLITNHPIVFTPSHLYIYFFFHHSQYTALRYRFSFLGNMQTVVGDLTSSEFQNPQTCLVQILNCVAVRPHGLSKTLAMKYPYSNLYIKRRSIKNLNRAIVQDRPKPGTLDICRPNSLNPTGPMVANLYAQFYMGKDLNRNLSSKMLTKTLKKQIDQPHKDPDLLAGLLVDTRENRINWFSSSLRCLLKKIPEENIRKVVFPFHIGCGLAAGNWKKDYLPAIRAFSAEASKMDVEIVIVQKI